MIAVGVPVAIRNLFEGRTRFVISVGGVALAILLVVVLDAVFAGAMRQVTVYMDNTPFGLAVAQKGVKNMHMTSSLFPARDARKIEQVDGVRRVSTILYTSDFLVSGDNRSTAYVIGFKDGELGGPWTIAEGTSKLERWEIVIDRDIAKKYGLQVGDKIKVLGRKWTVAGLTKDTVSITNSIAFVRFEDFERARGLRGVVSFAFVDVEPGADSGGVARRIQHTIEDVTVQTRGEFAHSEQRVISDMSADIIWMMNVIGFLIGLAALGLTVYTATLGKTREYGVIKALGARNLRLFGIVVQQAFISVVIGLAAALAGAYGLMAALAAAGSNIMLVIEPASVERVFLTSSIIALLASAIPIARIVRLRPAEVFRR